MDLRHAYRRTKHAYRCAVGRAIRVPVVSGIPTRRYGSEYGGWDVYPNGIDCDAVIYSIGVGEDVSFDLSLIDALGVTVHAFDPTPRVVEWISSLKLPTSLVFHPYGIAEYDGTAEFFPPENKTFVSHSMIQKAGKPGVKVPVRRLSTVMKELGHDKIDVLKMDIEGAEYAVIEDIFSEKVPIDQLLVEFHDRFKEVGIGKTRTAIEMLMTNGFVPIAIGESGDEYSFVHSSRLNGHRQK